MRAFERVERWDLKIAERIWFHIFCENLSGDSRDGL